MLSQMSLYFNFKHNLKSNLKPVDETVQIFLLPAIIGETIFEEERELYSLPVQSGGFSEKTCNKLENSLTITAPLVALIINHVTSLSNADEIKEATKVTTQKTTEQLTNNSSKLKQIWILIKKGRSFKQKERVLLAG